MGTWDAGNFDNDDAMDQLGGLVSEMVQKIEFAIDNELLEPDETQGVWLPCQVEILTLFAQRFNVTLPSVETITRWRDEYIEVWEGYIDELEPDPDYRRERRTVLDSTFNDAIQESAKQHSP
ncbi:hypothetical protein FHU41_000110 [Psychromicrobium silvestre]|uniref:DUF4259 domain-containing protein n=1 Tax=Psychromicrobium silvestre TaxID=1645614 RepID=A0A7Y9S3L3_9MICC|nr:DUF4259 domain-containing protein [Psychromicrobium silvestre]NYE93889.1 hypothetical protein [Psychromicrobium silvestre]